MEGQKNTEAITDVHAWYATKTRRPLATIKRHLWRYYFWLVVVVVRDKLFRGNWTTCGSREKTNRYSRGVRENASTRRQRWISWQERKMIQNIERHKFDQVSPVATTTMFSHRWLSALISCHGQGFIRKFMLGLWQRCSSGSQEQHGWLQMAEETEKQKQLRGGHRYD